MEGSAPPTRTASEFFAADLGTDDPEVARAIGSEFDRQQDHIELIASENIVSPAVLEATGSVMTNKYAEGYPGRRYYGGCEYMDEIENLAVARTKALFGCGFANVQPHSGSQANQAAFMALIKPGDTFLGMALAAGGHLTHGARPNQSGKWFDAVAYGVRREDARIDYDEVGRLAEAHKPKLIVAGGSAYPRVIDFARFRQICDAVGAFLIVDMAHFAGLVAGGVHPSPLPHAHVVTTTTHKTLRGARGGIVMTDDEALAKTINSAVFPGMQGGPLMHVIAAKAVGLKEALRPDFRDYARQVVDNARALAQTLAERGFDIVSGGTDTHLVLVDLRSRGLTGDISEDALHAANLTVNKNAVPFDPEKPAVTSGIRLGTGAATTRGFGVAEFQEIGSLIGDVLDRLAAAPDDIGETLGIARERSLELCRRFPIYGGGRS
jgi:glycine hydroxymethyltransferase